MISIVIPAHNESSVIARTLNVLLRDSGSEELDIVVVCNGCADDTANIARGFGSAVRVIESDIASKTHALNLGDQASRGFPRIYADADIAITADAVRALASRLERGDVLAVAPMPEINLTGCSWLVRKYFSVRSRLPSSRQGIGGSGVYGLSQAGRERFVQFPAVIADDLYIRTVFRPEERETSTFVKSLVFAPRTIRLLIAVRTRAYMGTFELAGSFPELWMNRGETNNRTLINLFKEPQLWIGLLTYCYVNIVARWRARIISLSTRPFIWERDETSRVVVSTK